MTAAMFAALLLMAQPVSGGSAGSGQAVSLLTSRPAQCVSVSGSAGLMVVLDRNDVEDMATPPRSRWTTEAERLRLVRFHQAQELISAVSGGKNSLGCDVAGNIGGGVYAMLALIREGKGRVWKSATNAFLPSVTVSAHNIDCSRGPAGHYTLVEPGGKAFFLIAACVV